MTDTNNIAELQPNSAVIEGAEEEQEKAEEIAIENTVCSLAKAKTVMHKIRCFFESSVKRVNY